MSSHTQVQRKRRYSGSESGFLIWLESCLRSLYLHQTYDSQSVTPKECYTLTVMLEGWTTRARDSVRSGGASSAIPSAWTTIWPRHVHGRRTCAAEYSQRARHWTYTRSKRSELRCCDSSRPYGGVSSGDVIWRGVDERKGTSIWSRSRAFLRTYDRDRAH
ncbi:hypothetical protein DAEQUDRAFT_732768 [Daedalea quercina L-15889]|uniref:Uncharacterized protein n=1 Tax=Daedalea quercina L-15889 TaxID=1314783 RepID=A0A165LER3_9APHY|nr:hypothetical protein DAEQUDRAFT_732768 [Daedalea quercina L-15889]